jgi:hypothetical protein
MVLDRESLLAARWSLVDGPAQSAPSVPRGSDGTVHGDSDLS